MNKKANLSPKALNTTGKVMEILATPNLGKTTIGMSLNIPEFMTWSMVYNDSNISKEGSNDQAAQRELTLSHARGLAEYALRGMATQHYFDLKDSGKVDKEIKVLMEYITEIPHAALQPFTCNIRGCNEDGSDLNPQEIEETLPNGEKRKIQGIIRITLLQSKHRLAIVDGQHRRVGFEILMDFLQTVVRTYKYPKKGLFTPGNYIADTLISDVVHDFWKHLLDVSLQECYVKIETHLGLDIQQEKQLYTDLNLKNKKVSISQALDYDTSDAVNVFIKDTLIKGGIIKCPIVTKDSKIWNEDDGSIVRKDLNPITCIAMFGHRQTSKISTHDINQRSSSGIKFWETVQLIKDFGSNRSRERTVAAQAVVLKGLARLHWELSYGKNKDVNELTKLHKMVTSGKLDFSHGNKVWRSLINYNENTIKKNHPGIENYVFVKSGTNLDAGTYSNNWVRYGSKHNDIYPRIGDLIRFQLKLTPRKQKGFNS